MSNNAELIVALDVSDGDTACAAAALLPAEVRCVKVGLELFCVTGPAVLERLRAAGREVFLDLKFMDIPRTVERAVTSAGRSGAFMMTVHASGGRAMLTAAALAAKALGPQRPKVVAVTVLTSLDRNDLQELGVQREPSDQVLALADLALACGLDGLVCSAQEVAALRRRLGPDPILVTPGIRMAEGVVGDQKRVATPAAAVRAGASYLVVGRPILEAADPASAARTVLAEMGSCSGG
ncbi:MAG: orotidine-5'-phosphate decarboxylase [bacterium]